jgi:hypothetical protein
VCVAQLVNHLQRNAKPRGLCLQNRKQPLKKQPVQRAQAKRKRLRKESQTKKNKMAKYTKESLKKLAKEAGIDLKKDYFELNSTKMSELDKIRRFSGYRSANKQGIPQLRAFFYYLQKK